MGRIIAVSYVTLDGVFEEPAWSGPYFTEELQQFQSDNLAEADAMLLGRVTYQGFAAAWPAMAAETGDFGKRMNTMDKYVASRTLTATEWNATLLEGDVVEAVTELKQGDRTLLINGSATLIEALRPHGLIDEYRLMIYPVIVGRGRHLFAEGAAEGTLKLAQARTTQSGVIIATYVPA
jgi:dihydrofolate reductase